jgi:hypothetical protein
MKRKANAEGVVLGRRFEDVIRRVDSIAARRVLLAQYRVDKTSAQGLVWTTLAVLPLHEPGRMSVSMEME